MVPPTKPWCGLAALVALTMAAAGCPEPPATPPPAAAVPRAVGEDLLRPAHDAAPPRVPEDAPNAPRSLELGLLRQPIPALPAQGPIYAVADFPLHTPALQDGTEDDRRLVEVYCVGCHSTTYISMQPPLPRERWDAEVKKMITVYGAAIPEPIAVRIATYLHAYYGNSPLPPRKRPVAAANSTSDGATSNGLGDL